MPIILSSASGQGVEPALRALMGVIEEARAADGAASAKAVESGWRP